MNKVLEELISNRKLELPDGTWANIENTSISTEEGLFLQKMCKRCQCDNKPGGRTCFRMFGTFYLRCTE